MPRLNLTEGETRALIIEEGRRLFVDIGYDKTTVADIARACGFSTANVHRVFGTKAQITEAIAETMLAQKIEAAEAAVAAADDPSAKLVAMVRSVHRGTVESFTADRKVHAMVLAGIEGRWEAIRRYRSRLLEMEEEIVAEGVASGDFDVPDVRAAALGLHMALKRLFHPVLVAEMLDEEDGGDADTLTAFCLRALGAPPGADVADPGR